jgi:hypothetical protein
MNFFSWNVTRCIVLFQILLQLVHPSGISNFAFTLAWKVILNYLLVLAQDNSFQLTVQIVGTFCWTRRRLGNA